MAALLTSAIGNEERMMQYVREAKRKNVQIFFLLLFKLVITDFYPEEEGIRYSLLGIRGIGSATVRDIFAGAAQRGIYRFVSTLRPFAVANSKSKASRIADWSRLL
ncbi:hypothetical protein GCM10020331_032130 [Ectobacillus funiculus]